MKSRVCVFTSTRADYGLLYWTMKALLDSPDFELIILATGAHLSPDFGLTVKEIESDGFNVAKKVEMLVSSDTSTGTSKSMGLGLLGYSQALHEISPDILLLLGDRYETFAAASAACVQRIPIAHCHGGETTLGAIDEAFRHAITKMSHIHFVSTEIYRRRVIQLGECPANVHLTGALGLENIDRSRFMSKEEVEDSLQWELGDRFLLITFHPETLEPETSLTQVQELLSALDQIKATRFLFTMPNSDPGNRAITLAMKDWIARNRDKAAGFVSLGRLRYLSAVRLSAGVIGNSSSGIIEVPSLGVGTLNIGDRQKGRVAASSVIHCQPNSGDILRGLKKLLSPEFQEQARAIENPYWHGRASTKILRVLSSGNFNQFLKKQFFDLEYEDYSS